MVAVSNTSPLVLLDKAGYLWILEKLFKKVIIPPAVDMEWLRPGGYVVPQWLSVATLSQDALATAKDLSRKIDKGEAEAISLFSSIKADWLLLDDLNARTIAKAMGFSVVGVLGILITAPALTFVILTIFLSPKEKHRTQRVSNKHILFSLAHKTVYIIVVFLWPAGTFAGRCFRCLFQRLMGLSVKPCHDCFWVKANCLFADFDTGNTAVINELVHRGYPITEKSSNFLVCV